MTLLSHRNQRRWYVTRPGQSPLVRLSAGGGTVVLAYMHKVEHAEQYRFQRRLAYLTSAPITGQVQEAWTKGGVYTAPRYVSVDRDSEWLVTLDDRQPNFLRLYGRYGEPRWVYTRPADILIATSSSEGRHIAAYRADGVLELLRVAVP